MNEGSHEGKKGGEKGERERREGARERHNLPGTSHPSSLSASGALTFITAGATHRAACSKTAPKSQWQRGGWKGCWLGAGLTAAQCHGETRICGRKPALSRHVCSPWSRHLPSLKNATMPPCLANPHCLQQERASLGVNLLLNVYLVDGYDFLQ